MPGETENEAAGVGQALDRLAVLEANAKTEKAEREKLAAQLAATQAENVALKASVDVAAKAEAARRKAEVDGYVSGLQAQARPCAIAEDQLAHVRTLFGAGLDAQARAMGDTLLRLAKGGTALPESTRTVSLESGDSKKARTAHVAAQLRQAGWAVEVSPDGSEITKRTPPGGGR